jgi:DNA repair protein RadD
MTLSLRAYQREAIDSIYTYFSENVGNPIVVLPTGSGKSLVIAGFIREVLDASPSERILVLSHVRELLSQNFRELLTFWPNAPAGIYSAGLGSRQINAQVLIAGIQSIHKRAYDLQRVDLVLVDECHLIPRNSDTMYRRFIGELIEINPALKVIGFTATPFRLDSGRLDHGPDAMFDGIAYEANVRDLIDHGYLCRLTTRRMKTQLDTQGVAKRGGEFIAGALERAVDKEAITKAAVQEIIDAGQDRKSWLVFGTGLSHCRHIAEEIRLHGIEAECVFGETPKGERDILTSRFKAGKLRCLVSRDVLSTGFNAPNVDLLALLRPTESTGLYCQIVGRALRMAPGKDSALILDFANLIAKHGPVDDPDIREPGKGDGEAPVKVCPECDAYVPISVMTCPDCGFEFPPPPPEAKLTKQAAMLPILSSPHPDWVPVSRVTYHRHMKDPEKPPTLRVEYHCGITVYREWVCIEHSPGSYPQRKAADWWRARAPAMAAPSTVAEALEHSRALAVPKEISVRKVPGSKFFEVVGARL